MPPHTPGGSRLVPGRPFGLGVVVAVDFLDIVFGSLRQESFCITVEKKRGVTNSNV